MNDCQEGFKGAEKRCIMECFLRNNKCYLWKSQVSLSRGHNQPVDHGLLSCLGIYEREQTYLSLPHQMDVFPHTGRVIPGFVRIALSSSRNRSLVASSRVRLRQQFVEETWSNETSIAPEPRGPVRVVMKINRKGVVNCGKFSHLFNREDPQGMNGPGRYMSNATFLSAQRVGIGAKGYAEERKVLESQKNRKIKFVSVGQASQA